MTADDWRTAVQQVYGCRAITDMLKLDELVRAGEHNQTMGPILDPTLWREKSEALDFDLALLKAAQAFVATVDATIAKAKAQADRKAHT
jgi:hypothetical protein